jgi:ribosome-associated protein
MIASDPSPSRDPVNDLPSDADDRYDRPSKTAQKKAMHELQALGEALMTLPDARIDAIGLPESLRDAVRSAQRTKTFEGKRRQVQYLGKLMRRADVEPIRDAVAAFQLGHAKDALALHEAERWRAELIAGDDALARWTAAHPGGDLQQLRNLVRSARKDAETARESAGTAARQGRAYRELFQLLRAALNARGATGEASEDDTND